MLGSHNFTAIFYTEGKIAMAHIDDILATRRQQTSHDKELWEFLDRVNGRNLTNLSEMDLQRRLDDIDRNIQYLDTGSTPRDHLPPERGWLSPWWWLRARYWTLLEFRHRRIAPQPTPEIPPMPNLVPDFKGVVAGGQRLLVRISRKDWLINTLQLGELRFAPAIEYIKTGLNAARTDDEMSKTYQRPGAALHITGPRGEAIQPIGNVSFSTRRVVERNSDLVAIPYWFCSFSSDLDPRLFKDFASCDPSQDACLIIFDPDIFARRALPALNQAAPYTVKELFPNEYFDPYYPPSTSLSALVSKEMLYAYQREMRFVLDPEGRPLMGEGEALFVKIGSIEDIAGVYGRDGAKIAGTGPNSFLA